MKISMDSPAHGAALILREGISNRPAAPSPYSRKTTPKSDMATCSDSGSRPSSRHNGQVGPPEPGPRSPRGCRASGPHPSRDRVRNHRCRIDGASGESGDRDFGSDERASICRRWDHRTKRTIVQSGQKGRWAWLRSSRWMAVSGFVSARLGRLGPVPDPGVSTIGRPTLVQVEFGTKVSGAALGTRGPSVVADPIPEAAVCVAANPILPDDREEVLDGLQGGRVIVLASRTSMGKTALGRFSEPSSALSFDRV